MSNVFRIQDVDNKIINIPESFCCPNYMSIWITASIKNFLVVLSITTLCFDWMVKEDGEVDESGNNENGGNSSSFETPISYYRYFFTFDHVTLLLTITYFVLSLYNTLKPPIFTSANDPTLCIKCTWILFSVVVTSQFLNTILYWFIELNTKYQNGYDEDEGNVEYEYGNYNENYNYINQQQQQQNYGEEEGDQRTVECYIIHGGFVILLLLEGLVLNRIPIRICHMKYSIRYIAMYMIWTLLYEYFGIGYIINPNAIDDEDSISLYPYYYYNWYNNPIQTGIICCVILFLIIPTLYAILWLISLSSSCCCQFQGYNRRYMEIDEARERLVIEEQQFSPSSPWIDIGATRQIV